MEFNKHERSLIKWDNRKGERGLRAGKTAERKR